MSLLIRRKPIMSWADSESQPVLGALLKHRLLERLAGEKFVMLSLTYRREEYDTPLDLYRETGERQHVPLFIRRLERRMGQKLKGRWLAKLEFQEGGWVHFHVIVTGVAFLDHATVTEAWGHGHVWVSRGERSTAEYMCKYVSKEGGIPDFLLAEKPRSLKVVRVSTGFWRDTKKQTGMKQKHSALLGLPVWVPLGKRLEDQKEKTLICYDDPKFGPDYRTYQVRYADMVKALTARGYLIRNSQEHPGYSEVGYHTAGRWTPADMGSLVLALCDVEGLDPGPVVAQRRPGRVHSITPSNPDAQRPRWLDRYWQGLEANEREGAMAW